MILPGWNSINFTGWASSAFFWVSIGALVLLGVAEVASHFYGQRHDTLVSDQYQKDKYGTDGEIARLHRDTADANARASEANARAAEAQLALEAYKGPRTLSDKQFNNVADRVRSFSGQIFQVIPYWDNPESMGIANRIADALLKGGWKINQPTRGTFMMGGVIGVIVYIDKNAPKQVREAGEALEAAFKDNGIVAKIGQGNANATDTATQAQIGLNIGSKN